jgi:hypothetical protein
MHKSIPIVFALVALFILSLCSACMSQTSANQSTVNQSSGQNAGLVQISDESPSISFDDAHKNLMDYHPDPANKTTGINTIYYIHGTNVDLLGNASSWIFGVRHSGGTELLSYDRSGWVKIPWNVPTPPEEINFEKIESPGSLFSKNSAVIVGNPAQANPERRDLDLMRGIYTLTSTSASGERILTFNATTGELIR